MSALRCPQCLTNWPATAIKTEKETITFQPCPECGVPTSFMTNAEPLDDDEATSRQRHADFEKFYAEHAAKQFNEELDYT